MPSDDMGTGSGRRATSRARDTPEMLFTLILELQQRHAAADGLIYARSQVIDDLHNTPGPSQHLAVLSAQTLAEALANFQAAQLDTLERLELSRFGAERGLRDVSPSDQQIPSYLLSSPAPAGRA